MKPTLSPQDKPVLEFLDRVRASLPESFARYSKCDGAGPEALRKRLERLAEKGYVAASVLPSGRHLYRLSKQGVQVTGAPSCWAATPTPGIIAEGLSVSALAHQAEFTFPTRSEFDRLLKDLGAEGAATQNRTTRSRFVLRSTGTTPPTETRLEYWLAEFRPAADLARRAEVVFKTLQTLPVFSKLTEVGLFAVGIPVPSAGVRDTLLAMKLAVPVDVVVVEELQHLAPL